MTGPAVPPELKAAIARDLRPVRPLWPPWRRAALLAPLAVGLMLAVLHGLGVRGDFDRLGAAGWGFSLAEIVGGLIFVGLALRDAVPGRQLRRGHVMTLLAAGSFLIIVATAVTRTISPSYPPARFVRLFLEYCFAGSTAAGLPLVVAATWLAARALPVRPAAVGALYGFGAGLSADAGWRLFCSVSSPSHVLTAHGGAVVALSAIGALACAALDRWKSRFTPSHRATTQ